MADHKSMARRMYEEVISKGELDFLDELIHDDFVEHEAAPGMPTGKDAPRAFVTTFREAFPDLTATIEDMVEEGDKLVVRATMSGTHQGDFMGIPPTGKRFEVPVFDMVAFRGDKVIEHWGITDNAAMMEQLGITELPDGP